MVQGSAKIIFLLLHSQKRKHELFKLQNKSTLKGDNFLMRLAMLKHCKILTVVGLGSRILVIRFLASAEIQEGQEN
jgi:hypothetical protein